MAKLNDILDLRPTYSCPSKGRLHTKLYNYGTNISSPVTQVKNCTDLNRGKVFLYIITYLPILA